MSQPRAPLTARASSTAPFASLSSRASPTQPLRYFNVLTHQNGARLMSSSSHAKGCPAQHILNGEAKQMWLSETGIPQSVTVDLSALRQRPPFLQTFGFYCWHSYTSNPRLIELLVSQDGSQFMSWATLRPEMVAGSQFFALDPIGQKYRYVQVVVRETFGASKTYLNSLYFFGEKLGAPSPEGLPLELPTPPKHWEDSAGREESKETEVREFEEQLQETGTFEASPEIRGSKRQRSVDVETTASGAFTARQRPPLTGGGGERGREIEKNSRTGQTTTSQSRLDEQIQSMQLELDRLARSKNITVSNYSKTDPLEGTVGTFSSKTLAKHRGSLPDFIKPEPKKKASAEKEVEALRQEVRHLLEVITTIQGSFNFVCEKLRTLQTEHSQMKLELRAMREGNELKYGGVSVAGPSTLLSTAVDSASFARAEIRGSEALTRGQLTGRSGDPSTSPFNVSEIKHEIAQECLAMCRERMHELITQIPQPRAQLVTPEPGHPLPSITSLPSGEKTFRSQVQNEAPQPETRVGIEEAALERILERKLEDALGNVKSKLMDNYFQTQVRDQMGLLSARLQDDFAHLRHNLEQQLLAQNAQHVQNDTLYLSQSVPREAEQQHAPTTQPDFSYSDSKHLYSLSSRVPPRQLEPQREFERIVPERDQIYSPPLAQMEGSASSAGSSLPLEKSENIKQLAYKLNCKLMEKQRKLEELQRVTENEQLRALLTPGPQELAHLPDASALLNASLSSEAL